MTTHVSVLAAALTVTALLDWGAVLRGDHVVRRITKPTFMLLLIGLAWSLYTEGRDPGAPTIIPVMAALVLCLLGDVALLNATRVRFLVGLTCFLLAHIAYIWALLELRGREGFPWAVPPTVLLLAWVYGRFARHVVRGAGRQRGAVFLYVLVLMALVLVAAWKGDWTVLAGCLLFLLSDLLLGHDRFVLERRLAPLQVIVTYHLAQVLIVVGLLR